MLPAAARRAVDRWREPRRAAGLARLLWIVWAVVLWNVVFDHVIVGAAREYVAAAGRAAAVPGAGFANMDRWMRPAVSHGFWIASASAAVVLGAGLAAVGASSRSARSLALRGQAR